MNSSCYKADVSTAVRSNLQLFAVVCALKREGRNLDKENIQAGIQMEAKAHLEFEQNNIDWFTVKFPNN